MRIQEILGEMLVELRKQIALLKKLISLNERLIHERRGLSLQEREDLISALEKRRYLTTNDVVALLNVSRPLALKIMRELGEDPNLKYIAGRGNRASRIVKITAKW